MRTLILVACLWLATNTLDAEIVFCSDRASEGREIYTMNSDGSNQTRITFHPKGTYSPSWSPNGRQIVFETYNRNDPDANIWVMDADGQNLRQLTFPPEFASYPDWSPDGTQIAFDSNREEQEGGPIKNEIYVMDADGSNVKPVTDVGFASKPRWSPDGEWILFEGILADQVRHIYAIRPDGTDMWRVSEPLPERAMYLGGWSPDGKQILYKASLHAKVTNVKIIIASLHPAGQAKVFKREVLHLPELPKIPALPKMPKITGISSVSFGADGKSILLSARVFDSWEILRFRLNTRELIPLTMGFGADSNAREWDPRLPVSPQELTLTLWGEIKARK